LQKPIEIKMFEASLPDWLTCLKLEEKKKSHKLVTPNAGKKQSNPVLWPGPAADPLKLTSPLTVLLIPTITKFLT
jgi:hypothetical protein